jgi:hypothetical protein
MWDDPRHRRLTAAAWLFTAGTTIHLFDHLRRGQGSITDALYWAGNLSTVLQVVLITLVFTRHRLAPLAAMAIGFPLALGFASAHWLPEWSPLSDPLWEVASWSWFSFVASTTEVLGALLVGLAGLSIVRAEGLGSFARPPRPHPDLGRDLPA